MPAGAEAATPLCLPPRKVALDVAHFGNAYSCSLEHVPMEWELHESGFLPVRDPAVRLSNPAFKDIERLGMDLPRLVHERSFRLASMDYLNPQLDWEAALSAANDQEIERLFMLFSYFASAYVHSPGLEAVTKIPSQIAVPLVRLAREVDRPPILSYASYCLHNWRRTDPAGPVALGNIQLLQNFSLPRAGKEDEDWFVLVHVDIEARAGAGLQAVSTAKYAIAQDDPGLLEGLLEMTATSFEKMNTTLSRMPEGCSPEVYYNKVRPYIFGFTDIVYEECFGNTPQTYRGETGAQSSIVPTMLAALGVCHKSSLLTQHLEDLRNYMPRPHREFIRDQISVRDYVVRVSSDAKGQGPRAKQLYNECIMQLVAFRSRHFEYAVNYIEKKVTNPIATGGTPYIPWLHQLIEETKEYYLE
jgi:indoleamine 2,3-dioxygenase